MVTALVLGCCRPAAGQTIILAALTIKFGGRLHAGILLADGSANNAIGSSLLGYTKPAAAQTMPLAALAIKFGGKLPSGMLLTGCCPDNAVGGPFHQKVILWAP